MYNKYDKFLTGKGYVPVQEFFEEWDYVKDELVKNDRKTGTGNGTFHFFLGAKNTDLITKLLKGKTEIDVKHYIDVNMLYSMLGYCIKNSHNNNVTFDINDYSTRLFNIKGDYLEFTSQLKFQDTRPYFKQFHNQELLRDLLFPKTSKYKFKMYQHNISKDIAVCWILEYV